MFPKLTSWLKTARPARRHDRTRLGLEVFEGRDMPSMVTGTVWHDADHNGVFDPSEETVPGVRVYLSASGGGGTSVVTDAAGVFRFGGVAAGTYRLQVTRPPEPGDLEFAPRAAGGDRTRDSDVDAAGFSDLFEVAAGETRSDQSAGLWSPGSGSGFQTVIAQLRAAAVTQPQPPTVWLDAPPLTLAEGDAGGFWAYRAGGDTSQPLTVSLSVGENAEGDPLAVSGEDYALPESGGWSSAGADTATFAFGANETAVYLGIRALTDAVVEPTEGVRLTLQPGAGYEVGFGVGPIGLAWATAVDVRIADAPPVAAVTPSNLLVRAHQAAEWVRLLSAPGKPVTTVLNSSNSEFVRLVLPNEARTDADHARLAAAFRDRGVSIAGSPSALDEVVRAIYRGSVLNPPGYPDRYLVLDPDDNKTYVSPSDTFGAGQVSPDITRIPLERINEMVAAGQAQDIEGFVYAAWLDAPNRRAHQVVLERHRTVTRVVGGYGTGGYTYEEVVSAHGSSVRPGDFYRAVSHVEVGYSDTHLAVYDRVKGAAAGQTAVNQIKARREAGEAAAYWDRVNFAIHATPLLSTAGYLEAGDYKEAAIGALGDVSLVFGFGMWIKGGQATRAARFALLATTGAEAGVAAYRIDQGFNDLANGDRMVAAGRFAEAGLRLVGITPGIAAYLKSSSRGKMVAAEAEAAVAEVRAATAHVGGAAVRQTTLDGLPNARNLTPAKLQGSEATCGLHSAASVIDDAAPNHGPLRLGNVQDEIVANNGAGLNELELSNFLEANLPNSAAVIKRGQTEDEFLALLTQGHVIAGTDGDHWVRVLGVVQDGGRTWVRLYDPARGNYEQLVSSFMTRAFRPNQPADACNVFILVRTGG